MSHLPTALHWCQGCSPRRACASPCHAGWLTRTPVAVVPPLAVGLAPLRSCDRVGERLRISRACARGWELHPLQGDVAAGGCQPRGTLPACPPLPRRALLGALSLVHGMGNAADNPSQAPETLMLGERSFGDLDSVVLKWKCHFLLFSADRVLRIKAADGWESSSLVGLQPGRPPASAPRPSPRTLWHGAPLSFPPPPPPPPQQLQGCCPLPSQQEPWLLASARVVPAVAPVPQGPGACGWVGA